jgi:hypothetical protein
MTRCTVPGHQWEPAFIYSAVSSILAPGEPPVGVRIRYARSSPTKTRASPSIVNKHFNNLTCLHERAQTITLHPPLKFRRATLLTPKNGSISLTHSIEIAISSRSNRSAAIKRLMRVPGDFGEGSARIWAV